MAEPESELSIISNALQSFPNKEALKDLLSLGVCPRCIFRMVGVDKQLYSCSFSSQSIWSSLCGTSNPNDSDVSVNGLSDVKDGVNSEAPDELCILCLGVLQLLYCRNNDSCSSEKKIPSCDLLHLITEQVKREGHLIDTFSIDISFPQIISSNEQSTWSHIQSKYGSEDWFHGLAVADRISVKDALKLSITRSIENQLAAQCGTSSYSIRLVYMVGETSSKENDLLHVQNHSSKKIKLDDRSENADSSTRKTEAVNNSYGQASPDCSVNNLKDHTTLGSNGSVLRKVSSPCNLEVHCFRQPLYVSGRYLKYSRNVSQTCWMIDDERMGEASVEEIIGKELILKTKADNFKFHAAGREDIDVRMLGSGRPFLIEILNARNVPSSLDIKEVADVINKSEKKLINVRHLKLVGSEVWALMREGEAEKQKEYAALVWISRPLANGDFERICSIKDLDVAQKTPVRVLHRRSPLERKRLIHWMRGKQVSGSSQYFMLHLCTQAGTYIKEFVHGDLGRTSPSLGSILGCRAEILQLDVTDVKMDCFM